MGIQLPLPAGWAWALTSHRDPHSRMAELHRNSDEAKAKIGAALSEFAEKYGVRAGDLDIAMASIDDILADLGYAVRSDLEAEIDAVTSSA